MPYYDDYFNVLANKNFYTTKGYRYLDDFVHGMLPRRKNVKQDDINKLKMVKENIVKDDPQVSKGYLNLIQQGIEILERTVRLRSNAAKKIGLIQ